MSNPPLRTTEEYEADKALGVTTRQPEKAHAIDGITDQELPSQKKKKETYTPPKEPDHYMLNVANIIGLRVAAEKIANKLREKWLVAKFRMENDVAQAAINKTALADHYWLEAHEARLRLDKAYEVLSILTDLEAEHRDELRRRAGQAEQGDTGVSGTPTPLSDDGSKGGDKSSERNTDRLVPRYTDENSVSGAAGNGAEAGTSDVQDEDDETEALK